MKRRNLILLLGGASSGAMSVGTGAFSSMEAERGVEVDVVPDDEAYVGYRESDKTIPADLRDDGSLHLVTVTNRFRDAISIVDVNVATVNGTGVVSEVSYDDTEFGTGEMEAITGNIEGLAPDASVDIEVTVTVEGAGVTAQLFGDTVTRRFSVERTDQNVSLQETEVEFFGGGNAEILGDNRTVTVDVHSFDKQANSITVLEEQEVDTKQKLRGQLSGPGTIVGVTLNSTTYIHPQWNADDCGLDTGTNGGYGVPSNDPPSCSTD